MPQNAWMVRAGEGGRLIEEFNKGIIAIGWHELGPLEAQNLSELRDHLRNTYPDQKPGAWQNAASVLWRFSKILKRGDNVVTYDPERREYMLGEITGEYCYDSGKLKDHPHVRSVRWNGRVSRDHLKLSSRNSLGSTLALFAIGEETLEDLKAPDILKQNAQVVDSIEDIKDELKQSNSDAVEQARELIKDKIVKLAPYDMQELIAAVLRAMGYRTRVSPPGSDRGVDVTASPDGLGLQEPRIKVEVKHRPNTPISAPELRSFLGTLRTGDRSLYVSTGGFSREAKYEADRATHPVQLIDLTHLADLVTDFYEKFDSEGRSLLPLKKIYRPVE